MPRSELVREIPAQEFRPPDADPLKFGGRLKLSPDSQVPFHCSGNPSPISVAKDRRIQDIDRLVIETFEDRAGKVVARSTTN